MATKHVGIRAGSDIAFLGGIVNYILEHDLWFREYVEHYTNAPVIIDEEFADTEDLDGLFSGWDPEEREYDIESWMYDGMEVHGSAGPARAGLQADQGRGVGPRRPRRRAAPRRAARGGSLAAAPALRPPAPQEALRAVHARVRRRDLRLLGRGVRRGLRDARRELGPRADERVLLRGRLDAAHDRRPDDPRRGDRPAAAREHRPARRRDHRAPRPRVDPGLDRHPDALQHPPRLHPDAAHGVVRRPRRATSRRTPRRPAGGATSAPTSSA